MKQFTFLLFFILLAITFFACETSVAAVSQVASTPVEVGVIYDSQDATRINLSIEDFTSESIDANNNRFDQFALGAEPTLFREGWPNLPFISRAVLVPPQSDIQLIVHSINSRIENGWEPAIAPHEVELQGLALQAVY